MCAGVEPLLCRHRLVGPWNLLGLLTPASRGPDSSWDSRRAFHRSPPNELDRHAPSRRGLLDHPTQCSQPWPVNIISTVTIQRANDHHASALGASPGHHRLPSLPTIHCTDHVFSSDARQCPWNLHCKTSRNDHPANSQNVLAFGQPRVSGNVTLHVLPQTLILLARTDCVDESHTPPLLSQTQFVIAHTTQKLWGTGSRLSPPSKPLHKEFHRDQRHSRCVISVSSGHCRNTNCTS